MSAGTTPERILAAATTEFATHGLAGARIDRIAAAAGANKERIYAYFGDKQRLFETVLREAIAGSDAWLPERADDLPTAAGDLFDLAFRSPDLVQLLAWSRLGGEQAEIAEEDLDAYRTKVREISAAQDAGTVDASWEPTDLIAIIGALALAWVEAPAPLVRLAEAEGSAVRDRRTTIEAAMRRIVHPAG
jgi:AcrR family transcriptional regulator